LRRRQSGSAVVEMALVAPIVLLLMFAILEFSIVFFTTLSMQYAVREGARYGITGRSDKDPAASNQERFRAIRQVMIDSSAGMYATVSPVITVNNTTYATESAYSATMFGGPDDIVVIRLDCTWKLLTPLIGTLFKDGKLTFSVAATMKNESYNTP
jgi:Flp pilus assembly protein TadG